MADPEDQFEITANFIVTISKPQLQLALKRLYHKEGNHLVMFCVVSRCRTSNISQKYKLGNF
jgi:hypothetical protein